MAPYEDRAHTPDGESTDALTAHSEPAPDDEPATAMTPLPYAQILALCLGRIAEGMMFTIILPYINEMVHVMGVKGDVGKWSAAAEAVFYAAGAVASPYFAHLGDRFGRKPVYLLSLAAWGVASVIFGLQRTLAGIIIGRWLVGMNAGPGLLSRTMMCEITDESNIVQGFAVFSPANTFGHTIGPIVGGWLATPVPRLLPPSWTLFVNYPYLFPALATSAFSWLVVLVAARYVPETRRPGHQETPIGAIGDAESAQPLLQQPGQGSDGSRAQSTEGSNTMQRMRKLVAHRPYRLMMILFALTNPLTVAFDVLFPLFAYTSPELGGMGLSVALTGNILGASAMLSIIMTIFLLPRLFSLLGKKASLICCGASYAASTALFPIIYRSHLATEGVWTIWTVLLILLHSVFRRIGDFTGTLLDALIVDTLPSPDELALASSLVYSIREITRAIGIYAISLVFTVSTNAPSDSFARQIWWLVLLAATVPAIWLSFYVGEYGVKRVSPEGNRAEGTRKDVGANVNGYTST